LHDKVSNKYCAAAVISKSSTVLQTVNKYMQKLVLLLHLLLLLLLAKAKALLVL
jgi:hypothetical protein